MPKRCADEAQPPPAPAPGTTCALYLQRKRRYCRFECVAGYAYCGHHLAGRDGQGGNDVARRERVPCPLDPGHSIFAADLQRHLMVCPRARQMREEAAQPFYEHDCNIGDAAPVPPLDVAAAAASSILNEERACGERVEAGGAIHKSLSASRRASPLAALSAEALASLLARIRNAHAAAAQRTADVMRGTAIADEEAGEGARAETHATGNGGIFGGTGMAAQKHSAQQAAIAKVMRRLGLLDCPAVLTELGAGRGGLSAAIANAATAPIRAILVDRTRPHGRADLALGVGSANSPANSAENAPSSTRIKIDLRHLALHAVPGATRPAGGAASGPLHVAVAKHLCGSATDLALRCVVRAQRGGERTAMDAVVIATCCHHRCGWDTYVNRRFLGEFGIDQADFELLCHVSSWATLGRPKHAEGRGETTVEEDAAAEEQNAAAETAAGARLDIAARIEVGRMAKGLLDAGRAAYLREHGYRTHTEQYCALDVTPENMLLVGVGDGDAAA